MKRIVIIAVGFEDGVPPKLIPIVLELVKLLFHSLLNQVHGDER